MSKGEGKKFEEDFQKSIDSEQYYVHRIRDLQFYRGSTSIGDFIVLGGSKSFIFELKSIKGISLPLSTKMDENGNITRYGNVNANQLHQMLEVTNPNIVCGYIINFRKNQNTYFITAKQLKKFIDDDTIKRKSIPEDYCEKHGIKLKQSLKRTRYTYYTDFLKQI